MSLDPFFSLTPLNSVDYTYVNQDDPYAYAHFEATGVYTAPYLTNNLTGQYNGDRLLLHHDPVLDTDQTINNLTDDVRRKCAIRIIFRGANIGAARQYLLVFRLKKYIGSPIAQFFIGTQFIRAEALTQSPYDDIAILFEAAENIYFNPVVRLAAPNNSAWHGFYFMGVDCYLL